MKLLSNHRHRVAAVVTAAAIAVGGGAAAITALAAPATGTASFTAATAKVGSTSSGSAARHHRARGHRGHDLLKRADHAAVELHVKGEWVTFDLDRGTVTSVSPTAITLARKDGRSVTIKIDSATRFHGVASAAAVTDGKRATVVSEDGTARGVSQRTGAAKAPATTSSDRPPLRDGKLTPVQTGRRRIVVVEDDPSIAGLVELYLDQAGFAVSCEANALDGAHAVERLDPCLAVIDVGLPGAVDGLELCRRLRATGRLPIVMLTARSEEIDRIVGLELGADDYVTKPFSPRELVARVRAVLRRSEAPAAPTEGVAGLTTGTVAIDLARREVSESGRVVALTTREFDLLVYLARNAGLALSRAQILDGVWGAGWFGDERTIDVHVRQLRAKLGDGLPLVTVRGLGYRLD